MGEYRISLEHKQPGADKQRCSGLSGLLIAAKEHKKPRHAGYDALGAFRA